MRNPTHVSPVFPGDVRLFSQPYYWRADYGYRGDWQPKLIRLLVSEHRYQGKSAAEILRDVHQLRNVVLEMIVELVAVKPIRAAARIASPAESRTRADARVRRSPLAA